MTNTASQPVPVGVSSLPAVALAPGTTVQVGNLVLVRPVDTAPVNSIGATGYCPSNNCSIGGCTAPMYTVPNGSRLVIEHVSGHASFDNTEGITADLVINGSSVASLMLGLQGTSDSGFENWGLNFNGRLYAEPGDVISVNLNGGPCASPSGVIHMSGYLVPAP